MSICNKCNYIHILLDNRQQPFSFSHNGDSGTLLNHPGIKCVYINCFLVIFIIVLIIARDFSPRIVILMEPLKGDDDDDVSDVVDCESFLIRKEVHMLVYIYIYASLVYPSKRTILYLDDVV